MLLSCNPENSNTTAITNEKIAANIILLTNENDFSNAGKLLNLNTTTVTSSAIQKPTFRALPM
jgi:tetrahydromethanopterin S-methyltransferase subunit H